MNLIDYEEKLVRIKTTTNNVFEGVVTDYIYPEDDKNNLEMIILDVDGNGEKFIGFYEKDIESIEIID